jgi:signal peptidase
MLKGDANITPDSTPVPLSAVHGVAVLRVPLIGQPTIWRSQRQNLPLAATTLLALSTGWIGLRPAPRGSSRTPTGRARSARDLPRGRHKRNGEGPQVPVPATAVAGGFDDGRAATGGQQR